MREVSYFVAASLDGYIARTDGTVEWLFTDQDYGYTPFFAGIDTVLIGRKTFQQIDSWGDPYLYASKRNIVFSRTLRQEALAMRQRQGVEVELEAGDPVEAVRALKSAPGAGRIWLVGGSELAAPLLSAGLVDEMVLSFHPVLLGDGIPLFRRGMAESEWTVVSSKTFDTGLVQLTYRLRAGADAELLGERAPAQSRQAATSVSGRPTDVE